jgi:hypothetical protein
VVFQKAKEEIMYNGGVLLGIVAVGAVVLLVIAHLVAKLTRNRRD